MAEIVGNDLLERLQSVQVTSQKAHSVLTKVLENQKSIPEDEAEVYTLFQALLVNKTSFNKAKTLLEKANLPSDFIDHLKNNWDSLPKLDFGVCYPKLVDSSCSSNYVISTSTIRTINEAHANVTLTTQKDSEFENIDFTCTREQLADLVYSLKSALFQVQKLA